MVQALAGRLFALAGRLFEALAELMHERVRKEFWGYASDQHPKKGRRARARETSG